MKSGLVVGLVVGLGLIGGCSTTTRVDASADSPAASASRAEARSVIIRKGDGTGIATWDEVVADMVSADVVLFGEMHGHPLGLAIAQELWEDILVYRPDAVLSMEFYERDQQLAVDDYFSGVTNREQFEKAARRNKGNNAPGHVRMLEAAKEAQRPMIAANAPRRYVSMARKQGYDALKELGELQQTMFALPIGDSEGGYQDRFLELMSGMGDHAGEEIAAGFFRSQSVWDATMGESIINGLELGSPVAHVVGYFHVQFGNEEGGSGLIDQIRLRSDRELKIVTIIPLARDDQELFMGVEPEIDEDGNETGGQESDLYIADYVVYMGAHKE